ncbi:MAG: hypothetical protein EKK55_07730 [Rhodocyclaceae bacterium]|nr:MAG: hypothetical protein EKK55_07730 [Rhodocyclaceae bacterium]
MSPAIDLTRWAQARELLDDVRERVDSRSDLWRRFHAAARSYAAAEPEPPAMPAARQRGPRAAGSPRRRVKPA